MVAAAIMVAVNVNAQTKGDWKSVSLLNLNAATLTGSDDTKFCIGWGIGEAITYGLTDKLAVGINLSWDDLGAKSKAIDKNISLDYLNVGPLFKYYATSWLAFEAAPQIGFLLSAKVDGDSKDVLGNKYKDYYKSTAFSLPIGVSFEPDLNLGDGDTFVVDFRYHLGLSKVNKDGDAMRNSAFILSIGYKFDLGD